MSIDLGFYCGGPQVIEYRNRPMQALRGGEVTWNCGCAERHGLPQT